MVKYEDMIENEWKMQKKSKQTNKKNDRKLQESLPGSKM